MTHEIEITGLTRISKGKPNGRGNTILAYFDVKANGIHIKGCALARTAAGGLVVWPPNIEIADNLRSVSIIDDSLRHGIMESARVAYRALGGTDADWTPYLERKS
jgi:hypothetical protein